MEHLRFKGTVLACCWSEDHARMLWSERVNNDITMEVLTEILRDFFAGGTQKTQWYMGLIANSGFDGVDISDTMSSHAGWTEATDYAGTPRPPWTPLDVTSGIILNTSPIVFVATGTLAVRGLFLCSDSTKGGTAGKLWNRGLFSSVRTIAAGQSLTVTYTVRAAGGRA